MGSRQRAIALCVCVGVSSLLPAQDPPEKVEVFCEAPFRCPKPLANGECPCSQDTLEVTFDGLSDSVFEYDSFESEIPIQATVVLDTKSDRVQGWSYGVEHDGRFLDILAATVSGTDAEVALNGGFVVARTNEIQGCVDVGEACGDALGSPGFISAVVLSFTQPIFLRVGRSTICRASYTLKADPGVNGTEIRFTTRLMVAGSPCVDINMTVDGKSSILGKLIHGWIKKKGEAAVEVCDNGVDDDGDCRIDCRDSDCSVADPCVPRPEVCDNGKDDDRDGRTDCEDSDCAGFGPCISPKESVFCNPAVVCRNESERCLCTQDTLEVTFDGKGDSIFEYDDFVAGTPVTATVVLGATSDRIQGWAYGVEHDGGFLDIVSATISGTAAEAALDGGFEATSTSVNGCPDAGAICRSATPVGFISAVILSLRQGLVLPVGRNPVCIAKYSLKSDPGPNGTELRFTSLLRVPASPCVDIIVTSGGQSTLPGKIVDGWVKRTGVTAVEDCGNESDDDGDCRIDCNDRDCASAVNCVPVPEVCDNQRDDDLDGKADCDDLDCASSPTCLPPPEVCDDEIDNDRDGRTDCNDTDCASFPRCRRESCGNRVDDDGDGLIDCNDPDCAGAAICRKEICDNGIDDDADAMADCSDIDCKNFPACIPKPEICDNGMDDDLDRRTDCRDSDCDSDPFCGPKPEVCDNDFDDDRDGNIDCKDPDCATHPFCLPDPEVCDNCQDDDRDGLMDCADPDCFEHPHCKVAVEVCDNGVDDDGDGLADEQDPDCGTGALLLKGACADCAVYFGPSATLEDHAAAPGGFVVSMRNKSPVRAFRLCLRRTVVDDTAVYEIAPAPREPSGPLDGDWVVNDRAALKRPEVANRAIGPADEVIESVERGPALAGFTAWDFLSAESPRDTGDGTIFAAQYVTDLNLWGARNVLLPTPAGDECRVHEVLLVRTVLRTEPFRRGDADGDARLSITDPLVILYAALTGYTLPFRCRAAIDANDDGRTDITDPIYLLRYLFQDGAAPPAPFEACGGDLTPEETRVGCLESNCAS